MATQKEIEKRRRQVQKFKSRGYSALEIAEKLDVHSQTIYNDLNVINKKYKKLVAENPKYLQRQQEKIMRFIDDFDQLKNEYYKLFDKQKYPDDRRRMLDSIRQTMVEQAKILKLIGGGNKYLQQNYIHIQELNQSINPVLNCLKNIITNFVPEDKQKEAFLTLKNFLQQHKNRTKVIDHE